MSVGYSYDKTGNVLTQQVVISSSYKGDVDDNGSVDLTDAILALQVASGTVPMTMVHQNSDVNADRKIGTAEAIFILQNVAGGN